MDNINFIRRLLIFIILLLYMFCDNNEVEKPVCGILTLLSLAEL